MCAYGRSIGSHSGTRAIPAIGATQLDGSAVGHVLPGGGATSIAATASMLRRAGIAEPGETATAFGAAAVLQMATTFVLRCLRYRRSSGGAAINHSLETAALSLGAAVFVALSSGGMQVSS